MPSGRDPVLRGEALVAQLKPGRGRVKRKIMTVLSRDRVQRKCECVSKGHFFRSSIFKSIVRSSTTVYLSRKGQGRRETKIFVLKKKIPQSHSQMHSATTTTITRHMNYTNVYNTFGIKPNHCPLTLAFPRPASAPPRTRPRSQCSLPNHGRTPPSPAPGSPPRSPRRRRT